MIYKLKTDLPTFKAGDLFYIDRNGSLRHRDTDIVAYHYSTLMKFPDALEKFWEPVEEEFRRWRAKEDETFYCVDDEGDVIQCFEYCDVNCHKNYSLGNYFKTRAEAYAHADYLRALAVVRDDAKGFKPDWDKSDEQSRWVVCFAHKILPQRLEVICDWNLDRQFNSIFGLPYFKTEEDARESIEKHQKEWETIFGVKDETENGNE